MAGGSHDGSKRGRGARAFARRVTRRDDDVAFAPAARDGGEAVLGADHPPAARAGVLQRAQLTRCGLAQRREHRAWVRACPLDS